MIVYVAKGCPGKAAIDTDTEVVFCEQETRCFDCLAELYGMLNEDDVLFGLWKRRGAALETRAALSCIQHGMLVRGQDFLEEAINKNQAGAYQSPGEHYSKRISSGTSQSSCALMSCLSVQKNVGRRCSCAVQLRRARELALHCAISPSF